MQNQIEILKLKESLKNKFSQLNNQELEEISQNLYELATFIVRLHIKTHSKQTKPHKEEDYQQGTARAP